MVEVDCAAGVDVEDETWPAEARVAGRPNEENDGRILDEGGALSNEGILIIMSSDKCFRLPWW